MNTSEKKGWFTYPIKWGDAQRLIAEARRDFEEGGSFLPYALFTLGFYTGFRISDMRKITWRMLLEGRIKTNEQKTSKTREMPVHPEVERMALFIKGRRKRVTIDFPVLWEQRKNRKRGVAITGSGAKYWIRKYMEKLGIQGEPNNHMMRKTFGLRVYEKHGKTEESLLLLSTIFNHSSIRETRVYLGLSRNSEIIEKTYLNI